MPTPRKGLRIARLFRNARGLADDLRACNLDQIREADDIDLVLSDVANPGYTACLVRPGAGLPVGIMLAPGQTRGRERFSIAHELGHYYIPTHSNLPTAWCGEADMTAGVHGGKQHEWEANDFAAELLMPKLIFSKDILRRDPAFREVIALADAEMYDVSVTAAAVRFVDLTREACALVCARDARIEWVMKSESFLHRIPWRHDRIPPTSCASCVFAGHGAMHGAERLDPYVWLEVEQRYPVELFESTFSIPSQSQVLSLVWVVGER